MCVQQFVKFYVYVYVDFLSKIYAYPIQKYAQTSYFNIGVLIMMKFDDKHFLAEQIKKYRKKAGLTQAELAEKIDLSVQHISRIESGYYIPSLKTFFMLVSVLNIDLRLFGFDMQSTNNQRINKLINRITTATDAELIFYENIINAVDKSLSQVKKELL